MQGDAKVVELLLNNRANISIQDNRGSTPLHEGICIMF